MTQASGLQILMKGKYPLCKWILHFHERHLCFKQMDFVFPLKGYMSNSKASKFYISMKTFMSLSKFKHSYMRVWMGYNDK